MLRIASFPHDADQVVPLELDGSIESQDLSNVLSVIDQRLDKHDTLRLYLEIKALGSMSASTAFNQLRDAIKHWDRFDKLAVVTDVEGVRTALGVLDKLASGMECKTFRFDEQETAQTWARA